MPLRAVTPKAPEELPPWLLQTITEARAFLERMHADRDVAEAWSRFTPTARALWAAVQPRIMPEIISALGAAAFRR